MAKIENIRLLYCFVHGLGEFAIKHGRKTLYGLINTAGKIVLEPQPKTRLYGLCSMTGKTILPCEYSYIDIGDTLDYIAVCKHGEWYYINSRNERVLL